MTTKSDLITPAKGIRRFDVFAEFNRQERVEKGDAADIAKGYGIWVAEVVAQTCSRWFRSFLNQN